MIDIKDQDHIFLEHQIDIKLDYLNHEYISGNKYRKLKYNLLEARRLGYTEILTFGGAYSNHIAAVAAAGMEFGFKTIGVIRGEELADKIEGNSTLSFAKKQGMIFHFVTRDAYRNKTTSSFLAELELKFGAFYLIPEGGTNSLAVKGCEEILNSNDSKYDYICCAVGTGGTISGIINSSLPHQNILGFPALKGDFLREDIRKFASQDNWDLVSGYHFGGYGKIKPELIAFINQFKFKYDIPLDPIYTGKMMYGIFDLIEKGFFEKDSKVLAIHTGGLQGISGVNRLLKRKNQPLIDI